MQYILTTDEMRAADTFAIEDIGIPSAILMENAARSVADEIRCIAAGRQLQEVRVAIFCGSGNNGGDGFALARHLQAWAEVEVYLVGHSDRMSAETRCNFEVLPRLGIAVRHLDSAAAIAALQAIEADILIDALLGIGANDEPREPLLSVLQALQNLTAACRVAIDVPTGLNADSGRAHRACFRADYCLTMAAAKRGMLLGDGPAACGEIRIAAIGIPARVIADIASVRVLEDSDVRRWLPARKKRTNKFDYGRVAVIAGSRRMPGAAALAANAAIGAGAGLVTLYSTEIHPALRPEVMPTELPATEEGTIAPAARSSLVRAIESSSVIIVGPGLGTNEETLAMIAELFAVVPDDKMIVVDADGLRALQPDAAIGAPVILTPHAGEFARLSGIPRREIEEQGTRHAPAWAAAHGYTLLLKGVPSIISDGSKTYWNAGGNPGMATAGSGDVLSGIIAAMAAQGLAPFKSAALGAYLHAAAGDHYASRYSQESLTASAIIDSLAYVFPGV